MTTSLLMTSTNVCLASTWCNPISLCTRKMSRLGAEPIKGYKIMNRASSNRSQFYGSTLRISDRTPVHSGDHTRPRTTTCGLPAIPVISPIINFFLSPTVILAIYAIGAVRLFQGMDRTTFSSNPATRIGLTAAWPVLFATSKAFREQFKKAVR